MTIIIFIFFFLVPRNPLALQVSSTTTNTSYAGSTYSVTCVASETVSGLSEIPQVTWFGPDGTALVTGGDITVENAESQTMHSKTLRLSPIKTSLGGAYTCQATIGSPALSAPYSISKIHYITVTGIKIDK